MLKKGDIAGASFWPETVQIKHVEALEDDLYLVEAVGKESNQFFENYLEAYQLKEVEQYTDTASPDRLKDKFQHYLQYHILKTEKEYSQSRARGNKNMIPLPHQIEAVYGRMLQSPQVRYLLADDLGAGKTIMSGVYGKMIQSHNEDLSYEEGINDFKVGVSEIIGNQSSSFLLDPEYGWDAAKKLNEDVGLIMAYEKTGYEASEKGRVPNLVDFYAVQDLAQQGVSAIKLLVYYDVEEEAQYNDIKKTIIKRVSDECKHNDILFIFEPVSYDSQSDTSKGTDFLRRKPETVKYFMEEFSNPEYGIDLLKVEVPVLLHNIEGFSNHENYNPVFSVEEASTLYLECSNLTKIPFIYLSGGVSNNQFVETLHFAKKAGSKFNGCLCGRAIWKEAVKPYAQAGVEVQYQWLNDTGIKNLQKVRKAINESATPWTHYIE